MEGKGNYFILLVIVAILALALCAVIGYLFFVSGPSNTSQPATQEPVVKVPLDGDLVEIPIFSEDVVMNLKGETGKKADFIQLNISVKVFKKLKLKGYKTVEEKVAAYLSQIKESIATYFQNMTKEDALLQTETKERAKKELKVLLNNILTASEKEKEDIVYEVILVKWFVP